VHAGGGVLSYHPATGRLEKYPNPLQNMDYTGIWFGNVPGLSLCSSQDESGNLWVGLSMLRKLNGASGKATDFAISHDTLTSLENRDDKHLAIILTTWKDRDGTIWLGTLNHGV